jgi:hypothetical protein
MDGKEARVSKILREIDGRQSFAGRGSTRGGDNLETAVRVLAEHVVELEDRLELLSKQIAGTS